MTPIQQMLLGVGASKKTYLDDIFATTLYVGNEGSKTVTTGIDLATDGGLVIGKSRAGSHAPFFYDTVRGVQKYLRGDINDGETTLSTGLTAFSTTGFSVGSHVGMNDDVKNAAWSFKKTPGFFDVLTYTGNGSTQNISHSLGCVPGCIMIKRLDTTNKDWCVYHRSIGNSEYLELNNTQGQTGSTVRFNATDPTASVFSVGDNAQVNTNSVTYVAYLFAGDELDKNSVQFDGTDDYLTVPQSSDYDLGTGEFTWECWVRHEGTVGSQNAALFDTRNNSTGDDGYYAFIASTGKFRFVRSNNSSSDTTFDSTSTLSANTWYHLAASRDSSDNVRVFVNGTLESTAENAENFGCSTGMHIGFRKHTGSSLTYFKSKFSNFRLTKGQCLYTANFTPATTPLTTSSQSATGVKLLCCNGSTAISTSKIGSGSISMTSYPVSSEITPFTSPLTGKAFSFGDAGNQNVIKCGSYEGNDSSTGPEINLGWEPQWILLKNADSSENWHIYDSMRGIATNGNDAILYPNTYDTEASGNQRIDITSTGFKIKSNVTEINGDGHTIIYVAIRRPDGYVGKPVEVGTDVFAMDTGSGSSTIPNFDSAFPVDFSLNRYPTSASNWVTGARLIQGKWLRTNSPTGEASFSEMTYDSNVGWNNYNTYGSTNQSWMWKRHAGFDVVTYVGKGSNGDQFSHSLNKVPEMMWVKRRGGGDDWFVYHKGLNNGSSPEDYKLKLNSTDAESDDNSAWYDTAPTSTHFTLGDSYTVNQSGQDYIAILFASVNKISKLGYYNGSSSTQTITTGFQPRLIIIKCVTTGDSNTNWLIMDTTRGLADGNDQVMTLNTNNTQGAADFCDVLSTGFEVNENAIANNLSGERYIYYAHA